MKDNLTITTEQYTQRLVNLCLRGLAGIPKNQSDQHILMKSAAMSIGVTGPQSEKELTNRLQAWLDVVKAGNDLDRVSLRRLLIENGYLTRDSLGMQYEVSQPGPYAALFEPAIEQLDTAAILHAAREEMERKKQAYLQNAKGA
jgi:hypothetical protein